MKGRSLRNREAKGQGDNTAGAPLHPRPGAKQRSSGSPQHLPTVPMQESQLLGTAGTIHTPPAAFPPPSMLSRYQHRKAMPRGPSAPIPASPSAASIPSKTLRRTCIPTTCPQTAHPGRLNLFFPPSFLPSPAHGTGLWHTQPLSSQG